MTDKTDRELLELAAKAAQYQNLRYCETHVSMVPEPEGEDALPFSMWNPLTDDGDALRLAGHMGMILSIDDYKSSATSCFGTRAYQECCMHDYYGKNAATRRAIVRVAAAIGEAMP